MTYKIMGSYQGGEWEEIDEANCKNELTYLLEEYRIAFGAGWRLRGVSE